MTEELLITENARNHYFNAEITSYHVWVCAPPACSVSSSFLCLHV